MEMAEKLSASGLYEVVREEFGKIKDNRTERAEIGLKDILMSGFAMFALKDSSLLEFDDRRKEPENLRSIYGIERVPCDTYMRTVLDEVNPEEMRESYKKLLKEAEERGILEEYKYIGRYLIISADGKGISHRER